MPVHTMNERVAVVVDGYSTGALYAPAFAAYGIGTVHVENRAERAGTFRATYAPESYRAEYSFDGDWETLLRSLGRYHVGWVAAGTESGVEPADELAARLGLRRNNEPSSSAARRDKLRMQRAVADAGVPAAWHAAVATAEEAHAVTAGHGGGPVVVKPLRSAGTDGVFCCTSPQEAAAAADKLLGSRSVYGQTNAAVLVQEYLRGDEYMVNCLSADGQHTVTEIWRSVKTVLAGAPVYDYIDLIPPQNPDAQRVAAYVRDVLDALGTRWGPSHTEVINTAAGPRLVESAARPQGTIDVSAVTRATGRNPVANTVHAMLVPDLYTSRRLPTAPLAEARGVSFICPSSGRLRRDLDWSRLRTLPSYHSMLAPAGRAGEFVRRTKDLFTRPGAVYLIHRDRSVVEQDHATIRQWERDGFYDIEVDD
ncbi:ATP-grasp domain-containing protein [Streptomyces sp. NBC_00322]|uniref:ATP-grasp domain-containing protein n=1 Tax=Streptomyces sp. NBC_00322 TaxID=2975712 RepID=UPI002E2C831D|nr:ATP-grasp domain-containing protein [Streptomyces sp. NBC_00322]